MGWAKPATDGSVLLKDGICQEVGSDLLQQLAQLQLAGLTIRATLEKLNHFAVSQNARASFSVGYPRGQECHCCAAPRKARSKQTRVYEVSVSQLIKWWCWPYLMPYGIKLSFDSIPVEVAPCAEKP